MQTSLRFSKKSLLLGGSLALLALAANLPAAEPAAATPPAAPAAPVAPAPKGPPLALPFTDDFESGELRTDVWAPHVSGGGTVSLVQGKGGFGKYVLQAHMPGSRSYALIGTTRLPESLKDHLFGRAYVYISPNGPPQHTVLTYTGSAGWPASNWLEVGIYHAAFQLSYQQQDRSLPARGETVAFGKPIPIGKWFCLEWEVNDSPDTLTVWADGELMNSEVFAFKTLGNTNLIKGITEFGLGLRIFGMLTEPFDVYYDNVAFDAKRIGPLKSAPAPMPAAP